MRSISDVRVGDVIHDTLLHTAPQRVVAVESHDGDVTISTRVGNITMAAGSAIRVA